MEEKNLNEKESLELIAKMIKNTQNKLTQNDGIPFLAWGYATVIITIAVWIAMRFSGNYYWNFLWFAIPAFGWPITAIFTKKNTAEVKTYVDRIISYIWAVLGIACFILSFICIFSKVYMQILPLVILLMGSGVVLTGLIIKFKPLIIGGVLGMAVSFATIFISGWYAYLVFAVSFIVMMIIPGHIINCKKQPIGNKL